MGVNSSGNRIECFKPLKYKPILVIGCMHGDEPQGQYLIEEYIKENSSTNLIFIPCLNPDGVAKNTRVNANGVDLNRNYPTKNWVLGEKDSYFGGESPASEIETQFLIKVIEETQPQIILTLHAPYKVVNYDGPARELANEISKIINYPVEESIGYPTPGSFGTWAGIERNIKTITLELDEEIDVKELRKPVFEIFKMLENYEV